MTTVLAPDADDALRQTLDYWQRLKGDRSMPARRDVNPADIPRLLPKLMLADVQGCPSDIRFRLVGTEVVGRFGCELTGRRLKEMDCGEGTDQIADSYRQTVKQSEPQYTQCDFWIDPQRHIRMQQLLLPLSDDGERVNMILAVIHCH